MNQRLLTLFFMLTMLAVVGTAEPFGPALLGSPPAHAQVQSGPCGGSFPIVADAAVSRSTPTTAHGGERPLRVSRGVNGEWRSLLAFQIAGRLPQGATIHSATLELALSGSPRPLPYAIAVHSLNDGWSEATVTWNTQPAAGMSYGDEHSQAGSGTLRIDVTTLVTHWTTGDLAQTSLALLPALDDMEVVFSAREAGVAGIPVPTLVIRCAMPLSALPEDQSAAEQRLQADLTRLRLASAQPPEVQAERGMLRFAMFDLAVPANVGNDSVSRAEWFLSEYRGLLSFSDQQTQLQLKRRSGDGQHLYFRQRHNGVPVWPAELGVHMDGKRIRAVSGDVVPEITLSSTPRLSAARAEALAVALGAPNTKVVGDTQLRYVNLGLLGGPDTRTRLAWQVNLGSRVAQRTLMIDANSGALIVTLDGEMSDLDLDLETANNTGQSDTCWAFTYDDDQWFDEDGLVSGASPDAEGFQAFDNITTVYNFWNGTFGRDSYDDDGEDIAMYIHVNPHPGTASYNWGCDIFEYGNGNITLDIMSHEFSHAVDESEAELEYEFESGALDESFADIFGHAMDPGDWTIGEGRPSGGAFRDMSDPPAFGDPDRMSDFRVLDEDNDNGGVHTNSGIHNKAAFLLTAGGAFNGRSLTGIGQAKAQRLFYNTLTGFVGSSSGFIDARNGMVFWAALLHGFDSNEVCQVRNAYAAVEVGVGDADCDGIGDNTESDNDGDLVSDGKDNCPDVYNNYQGDVDGDGLGNACDPDIDGDGDLNAADNCQYVSNANQANTYGGPAGDVCDDTDNDSVKDANDNCPEISNYAQQDSDGDDRGDSCDNDIDGDGDPNNADNCIDTPNSSQRDSDNDGIGDACDLCPGLQNADNADLDNDGLGNPCDKDDDGDDVVDGDDNCPLEHNPDQFDFNNNGVGYECDKREQSLFENGDSIVFTSVLPLELPVPDCAICEGVYLPEGYKQVIDVAGPVSFTARVIDSSGKTVGKSTVSSTKQSVSYEPQPYAVRSEQAAAAQATRTLAPDSISYRLQLAPAEGVNPTQGYSFTVGIRDVLPEVVPPSNTVFVLSVIR